MFTNNYSRNSCFHSWYNITSDTKKLWLKHTDILSNNDSRTGMNCCVISYYVMYKHRSLFSGTYALLYQLCRSGVQVKQCHFCQVPSLFLDDITWMDNIRWPYNHNNCCYKFNQFTSLSIKTKLKHKQALYTQTHKHVKAGLI